MNCRPIGSMFRLEVKSRMSVMLRVEADASDEGCRTCFLKEINCRAEPFNSQLGACTGSCREDNTDIHFVKVTFPDHDC